MAVAHLYPNILDGGPKNRDTQIKPSFQKEHTGSGDLQEESAFFRSRNGARSYQKALVSEEERGLNGGGELCFVGENTDYLTRSLIPFLGEEWETGYQSSSVKERADLQPLTTNQDLVSLEFDFFESEAIAGRFASIFRYQESSRSLFLERLLLRGLYIDSKPWVFVGSREISGHREALKILFGTSNERPFFSLHGRFIHIFNYSVASILRRASTFSRTV